MKTFKTFILEEYNKQTVLELKVTYSVADNFKINCPDQYQEDDIGQYLDDCTLSKMLSDPELSEKKFGDNAKYINDAYFEYDEFKKVNYKKENVDLEYKDENGPQAASDSKIVTFELTNLRYIIMFSRFKIMNAEKDIDDLLRDIFIAYESNDTNEYALDIEFQKLEYKTISDDI